MLSAFGLTLLCELPWYVLGLAALKLARWWKALLLGAGVNVATHPLLWWFLRPHPSLLRVTVAEVLAWTVEALLLLAFVRRSWWLLAVLSAGANATSFVIGLAVATG